MRDFRNIPMWSPCADEHVEQDPKVDYLIQRAAALLCWVSETETLQRLIGEKVSVSEAVNAIRAGTILLEHRESLPAVR